MIRKKFKFINVTTTFIGLLITIIAYCGPSKKDIQKLNNALIFDLFVNYELTEKNGNIGLIVDFFPSTDKHIYKSVKLTSNEGDEDQTCSFIFNESGIIEKISYIVNDKIYNYDFNYDKDRLISINITGKPRIHFGYDKKGRLLTITRERGGGAFEYNFEYLEGENKANIKLIVVQGDKRSPSPRKYYVTWDTGLKLESFNFDRYVTKNIKYSLQGDIISYSFSTTNKDDIEAAWDYIAFDEKQNWIERKSKDIFFNRKIEYK